MSLGDGAGKLTEATANGINSLWQYGIAITVLALVAICSILVCFYFVRRNSELVDRMIGVVTTTNETLNGLKAAIYEAIKKN